MGTTADFVYIPPVLDIVSGCMSCVHDDLVFSYDHMQGVEENSLEVQVIRLAVLLDFPADRRTWKG